MEYEISVILPVYNGEAYLKKAIDSVLSQSFIDFEFIICDDASGDSSINIIKSFEDDRIQLIQNQMNMGLFATLNRLVKMAKGKLIKLWSQDDIMLKNCLEEIVSFHKKYPTISFSYSDRYIIDENDRIINENTINNDTTPEFISRKLHDKIAFYIGSIAGSISNVTIKTDKFNEVGYFDEGMKIAADFDMLVKLTENYDIGRIQKPLVKLRCHRNQLSRTSKYYRLNMKEDRIVFNKLIMRSDAKMVKFGMYYINWTKGPLYFSFMIEVFRKEKFKETLLFIKEMSNYYNMPVTFMRWCALKFFKKEVIKPTFEFYF